MKKISIIFTLLISLSSFASSECEIRGYLYDPINDEMIETGFKKIFIEKTWEACYERTIKISNESSFNQFTLKKALQLTQYYNPKEDRKYNAMSLVSSGKAKIVNMYISVVNLFKWNFDDSMIPYADSNGTVSKYSTKDAVKGKNAVYEDNSLIK